MDRVGPTRSTVARTGPVTWTTTPVAHSTVAAAHRRDHDHAHAPDTCHPHHVEVVHLGHQAVAVCHDCCSDTGFLPERDAERVAKGHRGSTVDGDVLLPRIALD